MRIDCDNQSVFFLEKNLAYHLKKKNIDVQYHFVRNMVEDEKMFFVNVENLKNIADALTNSMSTDISSWCIETMGIESWYQ